MRGGTIGNKNRVGKFKYEGQPKTVQMRLPEAARDDLRLILAAYMANDPEVFKLLERLKEQAKEKS